MANPVHRYREAAISTANPLQLVVTLYDAAVVSLREARGHLERGDIGNRSRSVNKCISVLSELQSSLDRDRGGEIARSLDRLYDYMRRRIFEAHAAQDPKPLLEVETLLATLRSAWEELAQQARDASAGRPDPGIPRASAREEVMRGKSLNLSI